MKYISVIAVVAGLVLLNSCNESFLEITPNGALDEAVLATYEGVDALLISAYAMIDGTAADVAGWSAASSNWVLGSVRAAESNKGSDSVTSPTSTPSRPTRKLPPTATWMPRASVYEGISLANKAINVAIKAMDAGSITSEEYDRIVAQARALRGIYHFEAFRAFGKLTDGTGIPYLNEETDYATVTNTEDVRASIIADLQAGIALPNDMGQIGRVNKTVMQVFTAKAMMQMNHDYAGALPLLQAAENGTNPVGDAVGLMDNYGEIFDAANRNDIEAVYTIQYSVNDNSGGWNAGYGEVLNFPYKGGGSPGGCCGFFQPSQDFVNSFRTDASGLPLIDLAAQTYSYQDELVSNDFGVAIDDATYTEYAGNLDPRVDWSAGRRGIPYWDWGPHTGQDWVRDQSYAGPYSPKKQVYQKSQEGTLTEVGNWTSGYTANGYRLIRYADVLLLKAECEAMTNADDLGFGEVNDIRARAANSFVYEDDGVTPAANYVIAEYPTAWTTQAEAMHAIKFERKLELGQEGHRFWDLQRWGEVVTEINRVLDFEKTMPWGGSLYGGATVGAEDVNYPVPQRQIDLTQGLIQQNR
ncbi:MAG: RagB/SusD family nutrient uptake outer membrane protein [Bacteroidales bacterium]